MDRDEQHGEPRVTAMAIRTSDFTLMDSNDRDSVEREVKERLIRTYNLLPEQATAEWHFITSRGQAYAICVGMLALDQ
jgi:hypothetical protein